MKAATVINVDDALAALDRFDAVLDARSPSEFAEDHIPGALNAPVLDDAQRAEVGTLHNEAGAFVAKRRGAALVSRNIAHLLETRLAHYNADWQPLVYCWRGGNRSGSLATVMSRIGWRTAVIEGGYRAFRRRVLADLAAWPAEFRFIVIAGRTGSAKSRILEALATAGQQVLDLEALGRHRGSVLGDLPNTNQPTQKHFESQIWDTLRRLDRTRVVFVESESKKVGRCHVPDALIRAMRASPVVRVEAPLELRARFLLAEYGHFVDACDALFTQLDRLVDLHGHARIAEWKTLAAEGHWEAFVAALLREHYDPAYDRSMRRNYVQLDAGATVALSAADQYAFDTAAAMIASLAGSSAAAADERP